MSSRGWQALHGLADVDEQPATLSTGIPAGRRCGHQATPAPGEAVTQDRQIACLLPGRTVSVLLPTGRDPQHRAELPELPCRKPAPTGVLACVARGQRSFFTGRNMLLTCRNVEGLGDKKP
jgi:hypothetical protein